MDSLRREGKTKYIGLSECSAKTLRKAYSSESTASYIHLLLTYIAVAKIHAIQAEYSPFETLHESDGLIDTARELDVVFIAYGPLGHGWLVDHFPFETPDDFEADDYRRTSKCPTTTRNLFLSSSVPKFQGENFYANKKISEGFKKMAKRKKCTVAQVALAWIAEQGMIALPGTTKSERLEENWNSRDVELTAEDLKEMRSLINELKPQGDRYSREAAKNIGN